MNFLLGTLLIILLLFPGFIFRAGYLNVPYGRTFKSTIVEELFFSIVPSIVIHIAILPFAFWIGFNLQGFYLIMINNAEGTRYIEKYDLLQFILYCVATYIVGFFLGILTRRGIEKLNWEINFPLFRIRNEWYYQLTGFFITNPDNRRNFVRADQVEVNVVVELDKTAYLYKGQLADFVLSKEDGIDRLFIKNAKRKKLEFIKKADTTQSIENSDNEGSLLKALLETGEISLDDDTQKELIDKIDDDKDYYEIPGDSIIVPYKEVKNLNLIYTV